MQRPVLDFSSCVHASVLAAKETQGPRVLRVWDSGRQPGTRKVDEYWSRIRSECRRAVRTEWLAEDSGELERGTARDTTTTFLRGIYVCRNRRENWSILCQRQESPLQRTRKGPQVSCREYIKQAISCVSQTESDEKLRSLRNGYA